ncbi:MAG: hypothetical protein FWD15_02420 [Alphaproteobacteria bacterium]|nr:hypothetical protein [Alphaproteobacteria bacterium]
MQRAIILHGVSKDREFVAEHALPVSTWHWLPWLQQKYNLAGVNCQNPLFPHSWFPEKNYEADEAVLRNFVIDSDMRIVAWSVGAASILKYLCRNPDIKARHLVMLSPVVKPMPLIGKEYIDGLEISPELFKRFGRVDMFYSLDDPIPAVLESVEILKKVYPGMNIHEFKNHGHFQEAAMGGREFPELWEVCKSEIDNDIS